MNGVLLGPGPLGKAVTKPYDNITLWKTWDYCTHEGKIYKFVGEDLESGETWNPAHWAEIKITDEIINLAEQIAALDPEQGVSLYTDVSFTINTNQWIDNSGSYYFNFSNALIKQNSGIQVIYDESFRTALDGDIKVNQFVGYVTFITNKAPLGALSGTLRIIDSVAGVVPTSKGGTGAVTIKGARQNLNVSIRPIPINFGTVSSLPQTIYDDDITSDMIPSKWIYGNPSACVNGLKCTTANGSVTISLPTGGSFSGETTVYLELVNPRATAYGGSGQEQEQSASDYVQIGAQTLTSTQKAQVRENIGAASAEQFANLFTNGTVIYESDNVTSGTAFDLLVSRQNYKLLALRIFQGNWNDIMYIPKEFYDTNHYSMYLYYSSNYYAAFSITFNSDSNVTISRSDVGQSWSSTAIKVTIVGYE